VGARPCFGYQVTDHPASFDVMEFGSIIKSDLSCSVAPIAMVSPKSATSTAWDCSNPSALNARANFVMTLNVSCVFMVVVGLVVSVTRGDRRNLAKRLAKSRTIFNYFHFP